MRGKWERGIEPRHFTWIVKDRFAVSERPGGYSRNHRKVRRHEEILWLRNQGFNRIVSMLPSPHNLRAYEDLDVPWSHVPFDAHSDPRQVLSELYPKLKEWIGAGERLLLHQEELGERVMGVVAGYLLWAGLVESGPQAITVVERILKREMGAPGRELVALAENL